MLHAPTHFAESAHLCTSYAALGGQLVRDDGAMGGIAVSRASTASPDRPWSLIGDLPAWGEMLPTIRAVVPAAGAEADSDASIGIGSWFTVRQPGPPMAVYEVTE